MCGGTEQGCLKCFTYLDCYEVSLSAQNGRDRGDLICVEGSQKTSVSNSSVDKLFICR